MPQKPNNNLFATFAEDCDRLQPLRIEMYQNNASFIHL